MNRIVNNIHKPYKKLVENLINFEKRLNQIEQLVYKGGCNGNLAGPWQDR